MPLNSLCWEVRLPHRTGYLYGSFHIKSEQTYELTQKVFPYVLGCDLLALEVDLDTANSLAHVTDFLSLRELLSTPEQSRWQKKLRKFYHLELELLLDSPPFVLYQVLTQSCFDQRAPAMVDEQLWQFAQVHHLPTLGLESVESQLEILEVLSRSEWRNMLTPAVEQVGKFRKRLQRLLEVYLRQDIRSLYQTGKKQAGKHRNMLIYHRNKHMAEQIRAIFDQGHQPFIAVGAGHLAGYYGLLKLLKDRGFKLKPVSL